MARTYENQAIDAAEWIANDMWRKTGRTYRVWSKRIGKVCFIDIMDGERQVESFAAESWKKLRDMLRCARSLAWSYIDMGIGRTVGI